jgi:hypothetical protein
MPRGEHGISVHPPQGLARRRLLCRKRGISAPALHAFTGRRIPCREIRIRIEPSQRLARRRRLLCRELRISVQPAHTLTVSMPVWIRSFLPKLDLTVGFARRCSGLCR